ncbi:oxidoreductase [Streptomyces agglomeratus]|uniref:CBS domain-containing protein n=1 Tax=Streptomyces agglomeratus TaxID=285458 RepID=UPI000852639E|nr:CBS domain-containing protein [Streptomyces agglomeratus]OEJ37680.1 oxidoreductase [Streptomyces agglomeratus]OEJ47934.1 oxidoreductase [Streptomyces agglomeratus]OEJ50221.1 oxidoreductase [Streptomyces agglomeratus]OEJ57549.1 oxidoreductase [Streptomyces agglomeratus]
MGQKVREIMTSTPATVGVLTAVSEVAHRMREENIGAVLVADGDELRGLVTDRDLVVRVLAEGKDPGDTTVRDVCSPNLVTVTPDDEVDRAIRLMREHSLRRLPVVEGATAVGIVSLGDLAIERDPGSALGDVSAAPPNT